MANTLFTKSENATHPVPTNSCRSGGGWRMKVHIFDFFDYNSKIVTF